MSDIEDEVKCSECPNARHGFDRDASHNEGRYVCQCESHKCPAESLRQQLAEANAEIERLNFKLQNQALDCIAADGQAFDNLEQLAAANPQAILQLLDYIETLEKDAARYRWLRDTCMDDPKTRLAVMNGFVDYETVDYIYGESMDAAIDAAMKG